MINEDILFIEELIEWIEINLEKRPTLDDVAKISGYSKWHLQRKFKSIVGLQLASYIRGRVLTRAAVALRISRRPIIEISDELGFDSQQTFTRTFKKRFGVTPNSFRQMEHWDVQGMIPRFGFCENYTPEIKRISLPERELVGFKRRLDFDEHNHCSGQHSSFMAMKDEILLDFFKEVNFSCQRVYSLFSAKECQKGQNSVYYSTAIDKEKRHEIQGHREVDYISIPAGEFLSISHQGSAKECVKFSIYLFNEVLPKLREEFGGGVEMEVIEIDSCHAESKMRDISVVYNYLMLTN
ncbi:MULTISPECIES: helix-turn-helix domain-containing protein [Yersinia]|jgi:AraC-like DNA-binding protein/predicted transcriptional regulator YdeE|uniref:AraC family transcriptional regulator n=2 Tax=Yersinia intermedia TaxID=631 RepID=A0A0T9M2Z5_YERIN|nr:MULTISPECIES: helix-turn-helix domain-containing protein [Yersinia]AJJ20288.1 helix-turn-helix domain protein [Yersinia intermedia]ARB85146.1 right oriC-binding transcriptional activator [Yersinia sp. FDAARGOS_228]AVL34949.1 right oriC-binding transcriptional activator [Yersinia intermedia]EEQ17520.1 Transcriptional regulator, AraC family [Yersinia intermedia ATCC 29909]MCB5296564.1 helix-turn-helix domain-containing protein [Yersinia intermedia]